ncbi:pre-mRNA-splicing factor SYF1-like [Apteryx rowi]|uniref:pre-mRNA-splicing factor SYF1-like n=1 Tax=Apteryx rowi TaxID=308060 RepID=UPI000E1DF5CC|nr:pre-mRNA-splicing factor SYF1-like [Apteryx rowi]
MTMVLLVAWVLMVVAMAVAQAPVGASHPVGPLMVTTMVMEVAWVLMAVAMAVAQAPVGASHPVWLLIATTMAMEVAWVLMAMAMEVAWVLMTMAMEVAWVYKLWYNYLKQRRKQVKHKCVSDPAYEEVNNCHERALVFMHKGRVTRTRRTFDRALRALPITQHHRVWPLYLQFVRRHPLPETAVRVYRRYLKLSPENAEEYIEYLRSIDRLDEAAVRLAVVVNDERFVSKEGKSNYQLWHELCDLISQHPDKVKSLDAGAIIRGGLTRFTDQLGKLWCSLADYYIRSGHFEKARDVYEEAVQTVMTVRDFTQVFDSYAQFEESVIAAKMETVSELGKEEEDDVELELRLARFEQLIARRPLLLNSVLLRQNPHNVHEWHKRVQLYQGRPGEVGAAPGPPGPKPRGRAWDGDTGAEIVGTRSRMGTCSRMGPPGLKSWGHALGWGHWGGNKGGHAWHGDTRVGTERTWLVWGHWGENREDNFGMGTPE